VDLDNPVDVEKLQQVFRRANQASDGDGGSPARFHHEDRGHTVESRRESSFAMFCPRRRTFPFRLRIWPERGVMTTHRLMRRSAVFVDAIGQNDPRMAHVYFDVSGVAGYGDWEKNAQLIAKRIRQLGTRRVLFGSDGFGGGNLAPREAWAAFRRLPLSEEDFRVIETNTAPW
jgi:hypothetical protein